MQTATVSHNGDILLKRKEVMKMLRINSVNTMYKLLQTGKLKEMVISGGVRVFWQSDVIHYLEDLKNNAS